MESKIKFINDYIIDKMYSVCENDKISSTEQLLNFIKSFSEINNINRKSDTEKSDVKQVDNI